MRAGAPTAGLPRGLAAAAGAPAPAPQRPSAPLAHEPQRARRRATPPPRALHKHVAGWLEKPAAPPPPRSRSDAPQAPPAAPAGAARPLHALRRLLRPLLPHAPLVEYADGCGGVDPDEARPSRSRGCNRARTTPQTTARLRACLPDARRVACAVPQLAALWVATGVAPPGTTGTRVATALRHSYACVAAHAAWETPPGDEATVPQAPPPADAASAPQRRVLVGFARTVSVRRWLRRGASVSCPPQRGASCAADASRC
jgi:hypothetical protein